MTVTLKKGICLLLGALLLLSAAPAAFAEGEESDGAAQPEEPVYSVLREEEISQLIEDFLTENNIWRPGIGIGFLYTATGEEWYYNGDKLFYSASLYKVPLLMCVSSMVARGELDQDAEINGFSLTQMEEAILVVSNNGFAHMLMDYFWKSGRECRREWPALAGMENDELPERFYSYSDFTPRFMTRVLYTLYQNPEQYPKMIDFMKQAAPGKYFRYSLEDRYEIAQKLGYYERYRHTAGIIYTENPIIVTYMTKDIGPHGRYSAALAELLTDYARTLDTRLREQQEAERARREEAERLRAEEEARRAQAEAERLRAEAEERERAEAEAAAAAAASVRREHTRRLVTLGGAAAVLLAAGTAAGLIARRRKRNNTEAEP